MYNYPDMEIRPYKPSDYDRVTQILRDTNLLFEPCDTSATFRAKSAADPESVAVAVVDNEVVGCILVIIDAWVSTIYHLAIDPDFQNRGIGSELLQYGEDLIKKRGGTYMCMYVMSENVGALKLYARKDYEAIPRVTCVYKRL